MGGNEKKDSIAAIQASIDHRVSSIDTAPFYGFGLSEEMIGKAIAGTDRSKIQLLTSLASFGTAASRAKALIFLMQKIRYRFIGTPPKPM